MPAQDRDLIIGVEFTAQATVSTPPTIVVISPPKGGKSCLTPTLFDWPNEGDRPLVLAFDEDGPDSCAGIGFAVPHIKIARQSGNGMWEKSKGVLKNLENAYLVRGKQPYSSIVVDCGSTQADSYYIEAGTTSSGAATEPRQRYGKVKDWCEEFLEGLRGLGVPIIYLAWLEPPWIEEIGKKGEAGYSKVQHPGGINTRGSFRATLGGKAKTILYLERQKVPANTEGAGADGYRRIFHTKPYAGIDCGGRYLLPSPMPADLGLVLAYMYGMAPNPMLTGLELRR